jgi:capsular polysaccharide transport system ATP-binding protein
MIELQNVSKAYRTATGVNYVLNNITFKTPKHDNIGILGLNGAGKSTLLRIMSGVETPDFGKVIHTQRVSWPIGFGGGFNGSLSGEENARFVARIYGEDVDRVVGVAHQFYALKKYFYLPGKTI